MEMQKEGSSLNFVTHCDSNYLSRAIVLRNSLTKNSPTSFLFIVCHDEKTFQMALEIGIPPNCLIQLNSVISHFPCLEEARENRSRIEFLFCLTPYILRYLIEILKIDEVIYIDADKLILANPEILFLRKQNPRIAITSHNFTKDLVHLAKFGIYNVGIILVKKDAEVISLLKWWSDKCFASTSIDGTNPDVFGDQKYLDEFPSIFPETINYENPGVNSAPWNCESVYVVGGLLLREDPVSPLITFHFSGLKYNRFLFISGYSRYGKKLSRSSRNLLYKPYVSQIRSVDCKINSSQRSTITFRQLCQAAFYRDISFSFRKNPKSY